VPAWCDSRSARRRDSCACSPEQEARAKGKNFGRSTPQYGSYGLLFPSSPLSPTPSFFPFSLALLSPARPLLSSPLSLRVRPQFFCLLLLRHPCRGLPHLCLLSLLSAAHLSSLRRFHCLRQAEADCCDESKREIVIAMVWYIEGR
jgi:hypothetical protein